MICAWCVRTRHARCHHVVIADRLDLLQVIFFNQAVEVRKYFVEQIDHLRGGHFCAHRSEIHHIGEKHAGFAEMISDRPVVIPEDGGDLARQDVVQQVFRFFLKDISLPDEICQQDNGKHRDRANIDDKEEGDGGLRQRLRVRRKGLDEPAQKHQHKMGEQPAVGAARFIE